MGVPIWEFSPTVLDGCPNLGILSHSTVMWIPGGTLDLGITPFSDAGHREFHILQTLLLIHIGSGRERDPWQNTQSGCAPKPCTSSSLFPTEKFMLNKEPLVTKDTPPTSRP